MEQKQLDRMEDMLTNLIKIVGTLSNDFQVMKQELQDVKKDVEEVKKEQAVTNRILTDMRADQDHIWEKAAKNERELAKLKRHLQL
ncbi:hypothetical protein [Neobacillus drentensis]|jgi:septation ring formation regulator EzrA|uniref:hypothetical protein n=1 Tax=Neobacillus drentensis TaxID=220684 RepID=UPI002FFE44CC